MNDEASSSAAAAHPPSTEHALSPSEAAPTAAELAERRKKNRQLFNRKRLDLLDDLLRNLDILVYAELSTVYYMDCSFIRFFLRAFVQFVFLTPKPVVLAAEGQERPVISALFTSNAVCILCHLWFAAPSAGEATRGYLHGGLAMDFIGQKGPSSKTRLLILDVLVILLQLVVLSATMVRRKLKDSSSPPTTTTTTTAGGQAQAPTSSQPAQDLDSEERGIRRSDEQQDIEMQTLNPAAGGSGGGAVVPPDDNDLAESSSSDREALLASTAPRTDAHLFDAFHSGQIVLADLNVWKAVKEQMQLMKDAPQAPTPSMQAVRNELAARMLRMRMGTDAIRQTL